MWFPPCYLAAVGVARRKAEVGEGEGVVSAEQHVLRCDVQVRVPEAVQLHETGAHVPEQTSPGTGSKRAVSEHVVTQVAQWLVPEPDLQVQCPVGLGEAVQGEQLGGACCGGGQLQLQEKGRLQLRVQAAGESCGRVDELADDPVLEDHGAQRASGKDLAVVHLHNPSFYS